MKFLKISIVALFLSAAFIACTKDKEVTSPESKETPETVPEKLVKGLWAGQSYGLEKSIPVYLEFNIKSDGTFDVFNEVKKLTGTGAWTLTGNSFKAAYTLLTSGDGYSLTAELNDSKDELSGTWGHNTSNVNGGLWKLEKQD